MLTALDLLIFAAFLAYSIWSGLRSRCRGCPEPRGEYFLAGRTLPGWKAGLSMATTQFAADTPLLVTGLIATAGIFRYGACGSMRWLFADGFLAGRCMATSRRLDRCRASGASLWRSSGHGTARTQSDLLWRDLQLRGDGDGAACRHPHRRAVLALEHLAPDVAIRSPWPARAVGECPLTTTPESTTWVTQSANNLISLLTICRASRRCIQRRVGCAQSWIPTSSSGIALLGTAIYAVAVIGQVGAWDSYGCDSTRCTDRSTHRSFWPSHRTARDASLAVLGVLAIQWCAQMNSDGTGYLAQRTMACRSDRDAKTAALLFVITQVPIAIPVVATDWIGPPGFSSG